MSIRMAYPLLRSEGCSNAAVAKRSCSGSSLEDWEVHVEVIRSENIVLFWLFIVSYFSIQPHWSNGKHSEETKSRSSFTRYRFTWRQNEKEDVAPLGLAFGRINLGRMRNDSWHRGRSTGPRESVKKGGFGDGRGGFESTTGLRRAISLL